MKKLAYLCLIFLSLFSCVANEESIPDMPQKPTDQIQIFEVNFQQGNNEFCPDIEKKEFLQLYSNSLSYLHTSLSNQTDDLFLKVKSIRLCNIHQTGTFQYFHDIQTGYWKLQTEKTDLILHDSMIELAPGDSISLSSSEGTPFMPQQVSAWNPDIHPKESSGCYLLVDCQIDYIPNTENGYQNIAIPLSLHSEAGNNYPIRICLNTDSPWYNVSNDTPSLLFTPITFNPTIEDWENAQ